MITYKNESKDSFQSLESSMPVLAMCYDFDKTFQPDDMQAQGFIQSVGYNEEQIKQFWQESNELAKKNDMDNNLAYMYKMIQEAVGRFYVTRKKLMEYGNQVELYEGVRTWFERIRDYGLEHGVRIEHYIISSGLKEMIEGTEMAKNGAFKKIYASTFMFDDKGLIVVDKEEVEGMDDDELMMMALDAGAEDFNEEDDCYEITTAPDDFDAVNEALTNDGITFASAEVTMIPQTYVELTDEKDIANIQKTLDMLDDDDDVQDVYHNWDE